jgi:flagellar transcriptional activator FlhD
MKMIEKAQEDIMMEIRDANLNYLMLAQQMIRSDKTSAIYRLSISQEIADLIESLSGPQIIKLASSNTMLARFRFEDKTILSMLTNQNKGYAQSIAHSAILMAAQPAETVC